ncbi:PurR-regulated permease PerM [Haloferula helveola]|uniref:PurR-regulated permease PerM n=1 Tax=Haloferula helveola TaxID=490095 RepID=A0ABM7RG89_9BACT|nr:PurR-regulated permease PerM [Haloferula helveola]
MQRHPTPFQIRTLWRALTGVAIGILGLLLVAFIWLLGKVLGFLQPVIVPLAVAGIIAYLLDPVVRWFQKRGMSRLRAVIVTFASFLLAIGVLVAITIPMVGNQLNEFRLQKSLKAAAGTPAAKFDDKIVDVLVDTRQKQPWTQPVIDSLLAPPVDDSVPVASRSSKREEISAQLDKLANSEDLKPKHGIKFANTTLWNYLKTLSDDIVDWIKGSTSKVLGFLGLVLGLLMVPIYLYYFLKDASSIREHWHEYVPLKASRFKTEVIETLTEINGYMISFFRGQVLVAFIDGILIGIALTIFGLPLGLLIGIMMAIVGIIPFVGNIITLIPACTIAWFHYSDPSNQGWLGTNPWSYVAAVAAIFFIAQQINSIVTAPKIVGDSVGLHPMTVIFSMIFWSLILGGFIGALLAVPLTASIKVLFRRYIWEKKIKDPPPPDSSTVGDPDDIEAEPA